MRFLPKLLSGALLVAALAGCEQPQVVSSIQIDAPLKLRAYDRSGQLLMAGSVDQESDSYKALSVWADENAAGWHTWGDTDMPAELLVTGRDFTMNFVPGRAVFNNGVDQYETSLSDNDYHMIRWKVFGLWY